MSHFEAVGFVVGDEEDQKRLLSTAFERASESGEVARHDEGSTATYRDPSGALFTLHKNPSGGFHCGKPGFEDRFRARWRPLHVAPDAECSFCDLVYAELLDDDDEMVYPFLLSVETIGADRALIPYGEPAEVRFAALCEEGEVWPDEATFEEAQKTMWADMDPEALDDELPPFGGFSSRSVISSGTFGSMSSHIIAHGLVASVEERRNDLGGAPFRVIRLDTSGGVLDMCVAPGALEREELLAPGAVVRATLWLVGRPLTLREQSGPVPEAEGKRPGFLRRFLGRRT